MTWDVKSGKNVRWKAAIDRHGMSSPIVAGDRVFVTAADHLVRQVLCFDADTGKPLWKHEVSAVPEAELPFVLDETGFAAPTPVTDGKRVAALFATGELICVDANGNRVWIKQLGIPKNHYGHASSLIHLRDLVIVQYDQKEDSKVMAFEFGTGEPVWQVKRDAISWSSPILVENRGRMELILMDGKAVESYAPKSGKRLWRVECLDGEVAPSPAYADGMVFVASEGAIAAGIDVREHGEDPRIVWRWDESLPDAASPLASKDHLILPTAFRIVTCLDAKSGEVRWEHEFDKGFSSSPILVGDRVYLTDMDGTMQIFKLGESFEQLGQVPLGEAVYATPAFAGGRIYIRGLRHLFCIEEPK